MANQDGITNDQPPAEFYKALIDVNLSISALESLVSLLCEDDQHYALIKHVVQSIVLNFNDLEPCLISAISKLYRVTQDEIMETSASRLS